jgi:protein-disulfide isomerase
MNSSHTPKKTNLIIALFSFIGAGISIWQTRQYFMTRSGGGAFHSFCNIGQTFDCTAVEMSKYAELMNGIPLSAFAIAGYLLIFILALLSLRKSLIIFSAVSVVFSLIYLAIMILKIGKLCLLCLAVDGINVGLLIASLKLPKSDHENFEFKKIAISGAVACLVALVFAKALDPQAEMKKEDLNDIVESVLATPAVAIAIPSDAPSIGNADAAITIVKFSDYQCPACKMGGMALHPLVKRYPKQLRIVYMNYPLDSECNPEMKRKMHEAACESARIAICAAAQGKFIETYEALFEKQDSLAAGKVLELIQSPSLQLDENKLKECVQLPSTSEKIRADVSLGASLKIQSTPTFFVNGIKIEGGLPTSLWIEVIERLLKKN